MEERGLPGLQARYEFVPSGEQVELRVALAFDPAGTPDTALQIWSAFAERLAGAVGDNRAPVPISIVTILAATPLTASADGAGLREPLADFVASVVEGSERPRLQLPFRLDKAEAAAASSDIFPLEVRLEIGKGERVALASPRLDDGAVAFATAFEEAWQGFDGAGGRLALAAEVGETAWWCVRTGSGAGLALAAAGESAGRAYAVPPLSPSPLSGTIDSEGGTVRVEAIDLDAWWGLFAADFERLAAAAGESNDRFKRVRLALARAMAGRLVAATAGSSGNGIEEARAVFEQSAAEDLRARPVVVVAAVEVSGNAGRSGQPAPTLYGRAAAPSGSGGAAALSPGAVRLEAGRRPLAYAAPRSQEDRCRQAFSIRFEGDRIEPEGAPPLRLILGQEALAADLGRQSAPVPLIGFPAPLSLSVAAAVASPRAEALGAALEWAVEIAIPTTPAAQDRLELAVGFESEEAPVPSPRPAADGALFGALGRAVRFDGALPSGPDLDTPARFAALAEAVADSLPGWRAPAGEDAPGLPGRWLYAIDFGDLPALVVTREAQGPGSSPPWPELAGYVTPESGEATARYEPEAPAADGLRLSVPGLRLLAVRSARVHGRVTRNGGFAEAGPAFVYRGPIASSESVSPRLEWRAPQPEPPAANLEAALGTLLAAIGEGANRPYSLALEAVLVRRLGAAGESLETRTPLGLLPRRTIGDGEGPGLSREVAAILAAARAGVDPSSGDEALEIAVTLFDEASAGGLLARLGFRITVAGGDAWWGRPRRPDSRR